MGIADAVWLMPILGGAGYLLYRSVWKKQGHCQGCDNAGCSKRSIAAPALLLGCLLAPADATLAADGGDRTEVALASTAEIYHTPAEKRTAGHAENFTKHVTVSGLIVLEAGFSGSESNFSPATAQLGLGIAAGTRISGNLILLSKDGGDPAIDEATIVLSKDCWFARLGLQYLPFGHFRTHLISDPLTLALGETGGTAILGEFKAERFALSAFAFNGNAEQAGESDSIRDWGASLIVTPLPGLEIGASYLSDLADGNAGLFADVDNGYRSRVAGWSSYAVFDLGQAELSGEVLGAVGGYSAADGGGKPQAWNIELAFAPTGKTELAARAEGSRDFPAAAERRYGVAASWSPREQLSLSAEYLRAARDDGNDDSSVTARIALEY